MTDCCGYELEDCDYEECPDCGHKCCESCACSNPIKGACFCKHGLRGDAYSDQSSYDSQNFVRQFGYRGKFKPIVQVRMEKELIRRQKERVSWCGSSCCQKGQDGKCAMKLTDETASRFVLCPKCQSVAYCSQECLKVDATTPTRDSWDGEIRTHMEVCECYMDNESSLLPYVSYGLRQYKAQFGHYPTPLGGNNNGNTGGGKENKKAGAASVQNKRSNNNPTDPTTVAKKKIKP